MELVERLRIGRALTVALSMAATALPGAAPAHAQILRGTVLDSESGEPVMLAYVGLLAEGRDLVVAQLADNGGDFTLLAPEAGSYFLYVARTGYESLMDGLFELGEGGSFNLRIGLKPSPIEIEPVLVEAEAEESRLESVGFYDRVVSGRGHFLIREEIRIRAVDRIAEAFREIPGIGVLTQRPLIGSPDVMQNPSIVVRRGGGGCSPTLYVDRAVVAFGTREPVRPDDYVTPSDVEAIEVYTRSSEVPVEFDAIGDCGVVLIWTRMR